MLTASLSAYGQAAGQATDQPTHNQPTHNQPIYDYQHLTAHLKQAERAQFADQHRMTRFSFSADTSLSLAPAPLSPRFIAPNPDANPDAASAPAPAERSPSPPNQRTTLTAEALFFIPLTAEQIRHATPLLVYNITRELSTLEGIQYYSASRNRYRTFYERSYIVASPTSRAKLPDPIVATIPPADTQYLWQRDSSFGDNAYRVQYTYQAGIVALELLNLDTIHYVILPLVGAEGLRTLFAILPATNGIFFYGVSTIQTGNLFGLQERVVNSFTNRLQAVFDWFSQRLNEKLPPPT